jgi:hypothetical protein
MRIKNGFFIFNNPCLVAANSDHVDYKLIYLILIKKRKKIGTSH